MRKVVSTTAGAAIALTASMGAGIAEEFFIVPQGAGQLPAVSAPNFKLRVGGFAADGSTVNGDGLFEVRGSYYRAD